MSHFFGLGHDYKLGIHREIFSLCYHGQGGFTWSEVYELPIYLRRFYIQQINKVIEEKNKANESASKSNATSPNVSKPPVPRR